MFYFFVPIHCGQSIAMCWTPFGRSDGQDETGGNQESRAQLSQNAEPVNDYFHILGKVKAPGRRWSGAFVHSSIL